MPLIAEVPTTVPAGQERMTAYLGSAVMAVSGTTREQMSRGKAVRLTTRNLTKVVERASEQDVLHIDGERPDPRALREYVRQWVGTTWRYER